MIKTASGAMFVVCTWTRYSHSICSVSVSVIQQVSAVCGPDTVTVSAVLACL